MKLKLTLFFSLLVSCFTLFAQQAKKSTGPKKGQLVGVNFLLVDFNSVSGIKSASYPKGYSSLRDMDKGLSVSYWRGLTSTIDFSAKVNTIFHNYNLIATGLSDKTELGVELEPSINIRPFSDKAPLAPFATVGVGGGYYTGKFGGYVPAGGGIQFNFGSQTYLFVQAQYRFTLSKSIQGDNLLYSIGFAEHL
ncbi:MAG: hypothetical protein JST86_20265 [Bacteroidetes bacterium]|nr:hypothetical protein [Bacteroidota bacterium]